MRVLRSLLTVAMLASLISFAGCGGSSADVESVNLGYGNVVAVDEDGVALVAVGDDLSAVATIVYTGEGTADATWTVDRDTEEATAVLAVIEDVDEDDNDAGIALVEIDLPTDELGLHTVSFELDSSESTIEYRVEEETAPANVNEYTVSMRLGNGFCIATAESAAKGAEELALALTAMYIDKQNEARTLVQGSDGKIYPPENGKIATVEGQGFVWRSSVGGPWTLNSDVIINIKTYLYEIDGGGFIDEVLKATTGFSVSGTDDFIGSQNFDIPPKHLASAAITPANPSGANYGSWTGAATNAGEKVYVLEFNNGEVGSFLLELIVKVELNEVE